MTTLHHEIRIDAPPGAVWAVLADLPAVARYNPLVASARLTSPHATGVGASRRCEYKNKGFAEERVTASQEPRVLGLEIVRSSWPMTHCGWTTELRPLDGGAATLVTQDLEYEMRFGPLGRLMDLGVRPKYHAIVGDILAGLKREVEGAGRGPSGPSPRSAARA